MVHFDFDLGFKRAANRIPSDWKVLELAFGTALEAGHLMQGYDLITKSYLIPIRFPRQPVKGLLDLWTGQIIPDLLLCIQAPHIKSLLLDTGTIMWAIDKDAQLERAQQSAGQKGGTRVNLTEMEYSIPNQEMRALLSAARGYGKNLYMPHHVGGKYVTGPDGASQRIGDTWDGWRHLGAIIDVIVQTKRHTEITPGPVGSLPTTTVTPAILVETCGYTLRVEGQTLFNPTYDILLSNIVAGRALDNFEQGV